MLEKLFSGSIAKAEERTYETKTKYMESVLGKEHDLVMHAIVPYDVGGALDLYYFPSFHNGTAISSKELTTHKFSGPKNDWLDAFEIVMVSRHHIDLESVKDENPNPNTFSFDHRSINYIMNAIGRYSTQAKLNPYETIEFPSSFENIGGKCLILDILSEPVKSKETRNRKFGLMLLMEIHRDEMEFAMQQKGIELIELLKQEKVYPLPELTENRLSPNHVSSCHRFARQHKTLKGLRFVGGKVRDFTLSVFVSLVVASSAFGDTGYQIRTFEKDREVVLGISKPYFNEHILFDFLVPFGLDSQLKPPIIKQIFKELHWDLDKNFQKQITFETGGVFPLVITMKPISTGETTSLLVFTNFDTQQRVLVDPNSDLGACYAKQYFIANGRLIPGKYFYELRDESQIHAQLVEKGDLVQLSEFLLFRSVSYSIHEIPDLLGKAIESEADFEATINMRFTLLEYFLVSGRLGDFDKSIASFRDKLDSMSMAKDERLHRSLALFETLKYLVQ